MATVFKRAKDQKTKNARWMITWFDAEAGKWRQATGYTDKEVSLEKGRRLEDESARRAEGMADPHEVHRFRPIKEHVSDFVAKVRARNRNEVYLLQLENRITRVINGIEAKRLHDLDPVKVDRFLTGLLRKGKALSGVTRNEYVGNLKAFTRWAVEARRIDLDPLVSLKRTEKRSIHPSHPRRALSPQEVARLLDAAESRPLLEVQTVRTGNKRGETTAQVSVRVKAKLTRLGKSRRIAYLLAVWAGLRRSEVKALEWRDIDLDSRIPRISLRAEATKSKRADSLAVHPELAHALREAKSAHTTADDRVVSTVPGMKALRADLKLAGISPGTQATGFIDFHALRKTLSTLMAAGGMSQRVRQAHMRHTDPRLTETTYMDEKLLPIAAELAELPPFGDGTTENFSLNMHETGGSSGQGGAKSDTSGHNDRIGQNEELTRKAVSEVVCLAGLGTNRQGPASCDTEPFQERVKGVEPSTFTLATWSASLVKKQRNLNDSMDFTSSEGYCKLLYPVAFKRTKWQYRRDYVVQR